MKKLIVVASTGILMMSSSAWAAGGATKPEIELPSASSPVVVQAVAQNEDGIKDQISDGLKQAAESRKPMQLRIVVDGHPVRVNIKVEGSK